MRRGDTLVVLDLTRPGRDTRELLAIVADDLHAKGRHFRTLDGIVLDTSDAAETGCETGTEAGWYAMAGTGLLLLSALVVSCWVVTNRSRTRNAVELIIAVRGQNAALPPAPVPVPSPERPQGRRRSRR